MFLGEYHPSIDDKGRVAIPIKLRKAYGENSIVNKLVITHGFDKCIMAFREEDWRDFVENKIIILPQADPKNRRRMRFLLGGAHESDLDKQGRLVIPSYLQKYAEIDKEIIILGLHNRIEIWGMEVYNTYKPDGEELNSFASDLGF